MLPPSLDPYPRNSTEFFLAVIYAANEFDCVNELNPLDVTHRTRWDYEMDFESCGRDWIFYLDPCGYSSYCFPIFLYHILST